MVENKITHTKPLRPGERLRIPVSREITTGPEDSWETLAATYLQDRRRATFLAAFNKASVEQRVPAGTTLHVPFTVTHTAAATESLASISAAYFGDSRQAEMLKSYNFLQRAALERGDTLIVPVYHVRLQEARRPPTDAQARHQQELRRAATTAAATAIPRAWQAWRSGDYGSIELLLGGIPLDYLDSEASVEVLLLRGLAYATEQKRGLAEDAFRKALERRPTLALRRFDYSPKLLELWVRVGGKVE
jgi:LysM repeat protein